MARHRQLEGSPGKVGWPTWWFFCSSCGQDNCWSTMFARAQDRRTLASPPGLPSSAQEIHKRLRLSPWLHEMLCRQRHIHRLCWTTWWKNIPTYHLFPPTYLISPWIPVKSGDMASDMAIMLISQIPRIISLVGLIICSLSGMQSAMFDRNLLECVQPCWWWLWESPSFLHLLKKQPRFRKKSTIIYLQR